LAAATAIIAEKSAIILALAAATAIIAEKSAIILALGGWAGYYS
jgi:hypothetical protein